jgi:acyl-CoA synthetase (AMP-forming)/AMP-acid ligase II
MVIQSTYSPITVPETSIIEFIFNNPNKTPEDRKILIDAFTGESLTFGQFKENTLRFAASLQDNFDFKKGDVVVTYSPNQVMFLSVQSLF